ncbi:MAG: hypothetical protein ABIG39_04295 [Candidatus Micrarchaeota archaeon]
MKRPKQTSSLSPVIPIRVRGPKETFSTVGLLDSGADFSAITREFAEILGLNLSKGKKEDIGGIGGSAQAIKKNIQVLVKVDHNELAIPMRAFVLLERIDDFPVILGRVDFFSLFEITFKEMERKVVLKKISEKIGRFKL